MLLDACELGSRREDDHGVDLLASNLVRAPDDRRSLDRWVLEQHILDLTRIVVLAAADDHVLLAVDQKEEAVVVAVPDVPRVEPALSVGPLDADAAKERRVAELVRARL